MRHCARFSSSPPTRPVPGMCAKSSWQTMSSRALERNFTPRDEKRRAKLCWHFPQIALRMAAKRKRRGRRGAIPSYWVPFKICGWGISIKTIWCLFHPVTRAVTRPGARLVWPQNFMRSSPAKKLDSLSFISSSTTSRKFDGFIDARKRAKRILKQ